MSSYGIFSEESYLEAKDRALKASKDKELCRFAIHRYKNVYGSTMRKLLECSGWHRGELLSAGIAREQFPDIGVHNEFYRFFDCIVESYNNSAEYRNRKVKIRQGIRFRTVKKYMNAYLTSGIREIKSYKNMYYTNAERECFKSMRYAVFCYNMVLKTFFVRRLPKRISISLYTKCEMCDSHFSEYYKKEGEKAYLTKQGMNCDARQKGGLYHTFKENEEIIWHFVRCFLHLND